MNDIDKILERLSIVGNPIFLLKMMSEVNKFIKKHRENSPMAEDLKNSYLIVDKKYYKVSNKKFVFTKSVPTMINYVKLSYSDLRKIGDFVGIEAGSDEINAIFKELRRIKNIKRYDELMNIVEPSFSTNLSMANLAKIVINQVL